MVNTKQFWKKVKKQYFKYCEKHNSSKTITICQTSKIFDDAWNSFCLDIIEFADKFLIEVEKKEYWHTGNAFLFDTTLAIKIKYNLDSTEIRKEFLEWMVKQQF